MTILPERFRSRPHDQPHTPDDASSDPVRRRRSTTNHLRRPTRHESPLIVSLAATSSIDQSPVITLPVGENAVVRFQLLIKDGGRGIYRADLLTTSGETLFSAGSLKSFGAKPACNLF